MLRDLLLRIQNLSHVSELFVHLGYRSANVPHSSDNRVVACWKAFLVVGTEAKEPREAARTLARKLGSAGERALAVALGDRELVAAAPRLGAPASTRVLVVSLVDPTALSIDQLQSLCPKKDSTALAHTLRVVEALSTEVVGDRFFTEFRIILERMAASIDKRRSVADRHMAALLALTRVLFLYFIQAKGWLAGKSDYLRALLDHTVGKRQHFHRTALEPLFFGTLNRPPFERTSRCATDGIPYLNGGLFELHPIERRIGPIRFSNELWRYAFERMFDRFRFCIRESDEVDAIAPDMLGRVFERLMNADERTQTGTFYTPESVVRNIVKSAIATALPSMGLPVTPAERLMAGHPLSSGQRRIACSALRRLRILDPAVGSGAFLLGALELLTETAMSIEPTGGPLDRWQIRRRVLRENLFGVDLNPLAVRLSELRLWLAVVADDPTTDVSRVSPLPNLDGVVRQGNTLLDPISTSRTYHADFSPPTNQATRQVRLARERVFDAQGGDGTQALDVLRVAEKHLARVTLEHAAHVADRSLRELVTLAEERDLFGRKSGLTTAQRSARRAIEQNRSTLRRALVALQNGTVPFFSFEIHAPDIMAAGGFHVVVGNPPWVRAERLSPDERRVLRQRFSWWRARAQRGFAHLPDLALAFLQRALELTADGGAVGFLLPSKVTSAAYGHTARHHLVRETTITYLHRVSDREAAQFGATTYPFAVVLRKEPPSPRHSVSLTIDGTDAVKQASLSESGPWVLVPDRMRDALEQFRASGPPLRAVANPALGVKTGADAVLVGTLMQESSGVARVRFGKTEIDIERCVLRSALRGRDIRPFDPRPSRVVLWGYDALGKPSKHLPDRATQHVQRHYERLLSRSDYRGGVPWMLFRTRAALAAHLVVWRDIARHPCAVMLDRTEGADSLPLNSCYVAPFADAESALAATAVLNSTWAAALASVTADEARGGYRRINARVVGGIPVVANAEALCTLASLSTDAQRSRRVSQSNLDEAVAQALALPRSVQDRLRTITARHS